MVVAVVLLKDLFTIQSNHNHQEMVYAFAVANRKKSMEHVLNTETWNRVTDVVLGKKSIN